MGRDGGMLSGGSLATWVRYAAEDERTPSAAATNAQAFLSPPADPGAREHANQYRPVYLGRNTWRCDLLAVRGCRFRR